MNKKIIIGIIAVVIIIVGIIIISSTPINVAQRKYDDAPLTGLRYMYNLERNDKVASFYTKAIFEELCEIADSVHYDDYNDDLFAYLTTITEHDALSYFDEYGMTIEYAQELLTSPNEIPGKGPTYKQSFIDEISRILQILENNRNTEWELQSIPLNELMQLIVSFENAEGYYSDISNHYAEDSFTESSHFDRSGYIGESTTNQKMIDAWYYGDYSIVLTEVKYYSEGQLGWDDFGNFHDKPASRKIHAECYVFYKNKPLVYFDSSECYLFNENMEEQIVLDYNAFSEKSLPIQPHPSPRSRGNDALEYLFSSNLELYILMSK